MPPYVTRTLFLLTCAALLGAPSCTLDGPSAERARQWCLSGAQPRLWDDATAQARRIALCGQIRAGMTMGQIEGLAATSGVAGVVVDVNELMRVRSQCPGGQCGTNLCTATATANGSDGVYTSHAWFCTNCPNRGSLSYSPDPRYFRVRIGSDTFESCAPGDPTARMHAGSLAAEMNSEQALNKTFKRMGFDGADLARSASQQIRAASETLSDGRVRAQALLELRVRPGLRGPPLAPTVPLNPKLPPVPPAPARPRSAAPSPAAQKARQQKLDALGRAFDSQRGL